MKRMCRTRRFTTGSFLLLIPAIVTGAADEAPNSDTPVVVESNTPDAGNASSETANETTNDASHYLLRYRFSDGEVIRYRSEEFGEQCFTVGGNSKTDVEHVEQVRRFEVRGFDESGQARLVMQYESVEMSKQVNDEDPIVYRSTMKPSEVPPMYARVAHSLRRAAPQFTVMPMGTPTDENDEIIRKNHDESPGKPGKDDDDRPEMRLMLPLPEEPVQIGDSWKYITVVKVRMTEEFAREVRLLTTCRLESVDAGIARIKFSTSPTTRLKSTVVNAQLLKARPRGYYLMDIEAGRVIKRVTRHNNSVHGIQGPQSLVTYSSEMIEELLPDKTRVAQR